MTDQTPQTQQPSVSDVPRHPDRIALNVTLPLTLVEDVAVWQPGLTSLAESIVCQLADVILEAAGRADLSGMAPTPLATEERTAVDYTDPEPPPWVG